MDFSCRKRIFAKSVGNGCPGTGIPPSLLVFLPSDLMTPTSKVQDALVEALLKMARSPDLTEAEVQWLQQFVMHLVTEFSVVKEQPKAEPEEPLAA